MKRFLCIMLSITMMLSTSSVAFATVDKQPDIDFENQSVKAKLVNDHTIEFTEKDVTETVEVLGNQVIIYNENTGARTVLTVDGNTVHSSATGETITVAENETVQLAAAVSHPRTAVKKFSCAKIKSMIGGTATVAGVAGVIVSLLMALGFSVPQKLPDIITMVGGIAGVVAYVMKGSSSHGIKAELEEKKRTATRQGKKYTVWVWSLSSLSKY